MKPNTQNWEKTPRWKGELAGKSAKHKWLDNHFGKPQICENPHCLKKSKVFEWCLKRGGSYSRNRKDYLRLCRSCHRKYDWNEAKRGLKIIGGKRKDIFKMIEKEIYLATGSKNKKHWSGHCLMNDIIWEIQGQIKRAEQEVKKDIIEYLDRRASKLYCTADGLGYHDKNCEGLPCEKAVLQDLKQFLTK